MLTQVQDLRPLTSLRFFAAALIVVYHLQGYYDWGWLQYVPELSTHRVSFFFVLSGFILTHVYSARAFSYKEFLRARIARLWPVHFATLILLITFVAEGSITFDGDGIFNKYIVLFFNLSLTHSAFPFTSYQFSWNAVSWSISTELYFYLAFPFLLIDIKQTWPFKLAGSIALMLAVVFVINAEGWPADSNNLNEPTVKSATYANPLVRGFEFCLGMAL